MKNFTLEVTQQEVDLILNTLQELPHKVSHVLISKLIEQANEQIKPKEEEIVKKPKKNVLPKASSSGTKY